MWTEVSGKDHRLCIEKRRSSECFADVWKCCVVPEREHTTFEHLQRVPFRGGILRRWSSQDAHDVFCAVDRLSKRSKDLF